MKELEKTHSWRQDGLLLLLLLALVVPVRAWLVWNTEVTARDSIGFMRYALEFEDLSWKEVLKKNHQHPGYPLSIYAMSLPVRKYLGPVNSTTMQLSAQLASSLAAVLLLFPMYFLGKIFFERRVAFWGTLFLQFMPVTGQHLSDGISEALFLLFLSLSLLFAVLALRRPAVWRFTASGVFCGLAYLTRPEGAMVLVATLLALSVRQLIPFWRLRWGAACRYGLAMTLASLAVGSAYFGFTGTFTNKPSLGNMFHEHASALPAPAAEGEQPGNVLFASMFGANCPTDGPLMNRVGGALYVYSSESFRLFHYGGFVSMLLGLFARVKRLLRSPEFLLPGAYVFLHTGLVMGLALKAGYMSDRHLLAVALWGVYFSAAGLVDVPEKIMAWFRPLSLNRSGLVSRLVLMGFMAACMPRTLQKMHASQEGNHAVGVWLAKQVKNGDSIEDDHNWSHFYSGVFFQDGKKAPPPRTAQTKKYIVMTRSKDPKVQHEQHLEEQNLRSSHGQVVFHWPEKAVMEQARIVVYAVPGGRE